MARETEYAREVRARLAEMYPNKQILNISEVSKFTGRDRKTVKKVFPFVNGYISAVKLCNLMG